MYMPNWCNNFITFWSDGTPEGNCALVDLHNKMEQVAKLIQQIHIGSGDLWEVYLAKYGYGVDISCYQRGYIYWISDIVGNGEEFSIECYDAWSPNIQFWQALLCYFYQNRVSFTFQASEPGMQIYETNDWGILPRYNVNIYAEGVDELLVFDKLWNWDNPLFPRIDNEYVDNSQGQWVKYPCSGFHEGNIKYCNRWFMPRVYYWNEFEGDEDEVISETEELITHQPFETIDDIGAIPGISVNEWQYVDTDIVIEQEELCNKICSKIGDRDAMTPYGKVSPIYDNFTTFLGGKENE
jgi:hypothetical protein